MSRRQGRTLSSVAVPGRPAIRDWTAYGTTCSGRYRSPRTWRSAALTYVSPVRSGPGDPFTPYGPTMEKARVGGAVAVLVLMLAMLPLLGLATKLLGDGTGRQFYTEPSSAAYETAAAGQNMMGGGFALFAGLSLLSFALLRKLVGGRGPHGTGDRRDRGQHGIHHLRRRPCRLPRCPVRLRRSLGRLRVSVDRLLREIRANRAKPSTAE